MEGSRRKDKITYVPTDIGVTLILLSHICSCDYTKYQSRDTHGFTCSQPADYQKVFF